MLQTLSQNLKWTTIAARAFFSERKSAGSPAVLDYSGEHNIPITTNPYGFFLLFPCYLLLRACSLTLDIALPKIRYIHLNYNRKVVENSASLLLFAYFFFFYRNKEEKVREFFWNKKFFLKCPFLSLLLRMKRERKERKERENTLPLPTLVRALNKMDVASRACTLALAIAANRCTLAARMSFIR